GAAAPAPSPAPPPPARAEPPAPPKPAARPAAAAAPGDRRTFEYSDATSHKFWNVELEGPSLTITYGRVGTPGQTQLKPCADEDAAKKEADKLVAEKVKKGYRETTPAAPTSLRESLEAALVENPDELANHMAYAD